MDLFSIALTFFLIANPIGNIPAIVAVTKDFTFERQKKIMLRESLIALLIAIVFQFVGESFLRSLEIKDYTVSLGGGILLTVLGLQMVFPKPVIAKLEALKKEPYVVPIATPLITGGGVMSSIMLYSTMVGDWVTITTALAMAWVLVIPIMLSAPYLQKFLGKQGIKILEQLMGLLMLLISIQLLVKGAALFLGEL